MSNSKFSKRALLIVPVVGVVAIILGVQSAPASVSKSVGAAAAPVAVAYSGPADVMYASNPKARPFSLSKSAIGGPIFKLDALAGE